MDTISRICCEWLLFDDVGASSKTMCAALLHIPVPSNDFNVPQDADDLIRCIHFVRKFPITKIITDVVFYRLSNNFVWRKIAEHWDELNTLYNKGDRSGIQILLNGFHQEAIFFEHDQKIKHAALNTTLKDE